jgi:hypothetical protein
MTKYTTIVGKPHYQLVFKKTWIPQTEQWHLQFKSQHEQQHNFELFLTPLELTSLKDKL